MTEFQVRISRRTLPLLGLLLLAALLSFLVEGFFRQVFFIPLLELLLALYRLYRIVPQNVVWGGLIVAATFVALRAMWPALPEPVEEARPAPDRGRVATLAELLDNDGDYARWQVVREIEWVWQKASGSRHRADGTVPVEIRTLLEVCAAAPTYRHFDELRRAGRIGALLDKLDLDKVLDAMERFERPVGGR